MTSRLNPDQPRIIGIHTSSWLPLRGAYEVHLEFVKKYRRTWAVPRCYLSHLPEQAALAERLSHDLRDAGLVVIEQAADVVGLSDFVIMLDTPAYQREFQRYAPTLAADAHLIKARLREVARLIALGKERQLKKGRLIALALEEGNEEHGFQDCKPGRFYDETHYVVGLYDLVLNLYSIPLTHAHFTSRRQALHEHWEQMLARKKGDDVTSLFKIFISYSHEDETFKDELVTMLASLQRRGIVDAWHDRRIEAGDEWNKSIHEAMNDCDLALVLVSPDYLASGFIQEEEQPKLLQRREEMRLHVIPIIVRPCKWQSEPVLKDLQALPKDGKAIITFSKENGDRDQAWTDIATAIEERAKEKLTP
jgi:hypothetical protein